MPRYLRRSPPRPPRPAELALLARLADGPQVVAEGPVGRCLKKGWCRTLPADDANGPAHLELTATGAALLEPARGLPP